MDTLAMLEELLEQDQFELLPPKDGETELRLVYVRGTTSGLSDE